MSHTLRALASVCGEGEPLLAPVPRLLGAAAEDREVKISKPMQRYRGTPRMAQQNHQVRRPRVNQPRGHVLQLV
jgi:hypothetical protein